jgi:hypothetical protein
MTTFMEVARGMRKPVWFQSEQLETLLSDNYDKFAVKFTPANKLSPVDAEN